jgi:hypothetical protein
MSTNFRGLVGALKPRKRFILSTAAFGIFILAWTSWENSALRWSPLPSQIIPKPHSTGSFKFWSASGEFEVDMYRSMLEREQHWDSSKDNIVHCKLQLRVRKGAQLTTSLDINSFRHSGFIGYSKTDCFDGGTIQIPELGHYTLEIANIGDNFISSQDTFCLERDESPEDAAFGDVITSFVGYILCAISLSTALWCIIKCFVRQRRTLSQLSLM